MYRLIKSIDNFNPDMGVKFSTYAVPMIIGEIRRYLRDNNSIRVSRSLRDTAYKAIHTKELLSKILSRNRHSRRLPMQAVLQRKRFSMPSMPSKARRLYDPVYTDGGDTLYVMDQISDKKNKEKTGWKSSHFPMP